MLESGLAKMSVLIVDDNSAMRAIVRSVLTSFGVRNVYEAASAKDGFDALRQTSVDVAIIDWNMKPIDGLTLVKRIRDQEASPTPYLPVIMLTAFSELTRVQHARDSGVTEFMVKPFCSEALYQRLAAIINRPRPFVRTKTFFGPDRRTVKTEHSGDERREAAPIS